MSLEKFYNEGLEKGEISNDLFEKYNVKKGLRNSDGTGVLVTLTKICDVHGYIMEQDKKIDDEGHLYYRGHDILELKNNSLKSFGFERICFLILFSKLPSDLELMEFHQILSKDYLLPKGFYENVIFHNPSRNLMNSISRSVLTLYSYDENPDSSDSFETLKKGISLLAKMPSLISASYNAKRHYLNNESLIIHNPRSDYSIAENILYMTRLDGKFTDFEKEVLDLCLMVHADHGAGNNSAFVGVVISSTKTDLYATIAGCLASLKGPRHGGANKSVMDMMNTIINDVGIDATDMQILNIIHLILQKKYFDHSGLIYGIGHAVYTKSDPRCEILRSTCKDLCNKQGKEDLFNFFYRFEQLAINIINEQKQKSSTCANVDFYSGLVYDLLNIPHELYTPIFATARLIGWLAHNIENKLYCDKIIRPAAKYVGDYYEE